jgi:hypothetical protein
MGGARQPVPNNKEPWQVPRGGCIGVGYALRLYLIGAVVILIIAKLAGWI